MKITFVLPYAGLQGGIRVIAIYADRLRRRGHDVQVISQPQVMSIRQTAKSLLLGHGLPKPQPSYFDESDVPHRILESARAVTDGDVPDGDVVIATFYTTASGVQKLSRSKGAKVIFIQNYEVAPGKSNPALDASWRMPMHKIVISNWLLALARDKFADNSVSHVPNGVDMEQFNAPARPKNAIPAVGILYSTNALKGGRVVLRALNRVRAAIPTLRVVSFGAERPDFRLPLPASTQFHYRPPQDVLRSIYAQCDVWLCGSHVEGFHLPPLEAMACRCPIVSTRVGGSMDVIEEGVNGHLVDVNDDKALADRVLRVLRLPNSDWKLMSDAARQTAMGFNWEKATVLFEQALWVAIARSRCESSSPAVATRAVSAA